MGSRTSAAVLAVLLALVAPAASDAAAGSSARSADAWTHVAGKRAASRSGTPPAVRPDRFQALSLERGSLESVLDDAPRSSRSPLTISLPAPDGSFERFAVNESSVMEPGLAREHPDFATYEGTGIDEPGATVHLDLTSLGFHASVRGPGGAWYIDPRFQRDQSVYASYYGRDVTRSTLGTFVEPDMGATLHCPGSSLGEPRRRRRAAEDLSAGTRERSLVLLVFGGNVAAAKVTLVNRINQVYEEDLAVHLVLIAGNDSLNLDTAAKMTGANGPCGTAACYTPAEAASCGDAFARTRIVTGQIVGAGSFDIGHLAMGSGVGGIAGLGVVGATARRRGCTGIPRRPATRSPWTSWRTRWATSSAATTPSTARTATAAPTASRPRPSSLAAAADHGLRGHLWPGGPAAPQRPLLLTAQRPEIAAYTTVARPPATRSRRSRSAASTRAATVHPHLQRPARRAPIVRGANYNAASIKAAVEGDHRVEPVTVGGSATPRAPTTPASS